LIKELMKNRYPRRVLRGKLKKKNRGCVVSPRVYLHFRNVVFQSPTRCLSNRRRTCRLNPRASYLRLRVPQRRRQTYRRLTVDRRDWFEVCSVRPFRRPRRARPSFRTPRTFVASARYTPPCPPRRGTSWLLKSTTASRRKTPRSSCDCERKLSVLYGQTVCLDLGNAQYVPPFVGRESSPVQEPWSVAHGDLDHGQHQEPRHFPERDLKHR
jgi:hypothetical protein